MKESFELWLREFDQAQKQRRVKAKSKIELPVGLVFSRTLLPNAPRVYAALKYLQLGKEPVKVSHRELAALTGLSLKTVMKSLGQLKAGGWLDVQYFWGSVNTYDFPDQDSDGGYR